MWSLPFLHRLGYSSLQKAEKVDIGVKVTIRVLCLISAHAFIPSPAIVQWQTAMNWAVHAG